MEDQDVTQFAQRVEAVEKKIIDVEKKVDAQAVQYVEQYTNIKVEMGKLEKSVDGIREQARAHSEMHAQAISNLNIHFNKEFEVVKSAIFNTGMEVQKSVDGIIRALGIGEDPQGEASLRENLSFLKQVRGVSGETVKWIWKGLVLMILAYIAGTFAKGLGK